MKPIKLTIKTKTEKYPIIIGQKLMDHFGQILIKNSINCNNYLLVIDKNISKKVISKITNSLKGKKIFTYFFTASEKNKNQKKLNQILNILLNKNFSRHDCLISIGGGITGDVSGFAASIFKRGLKFVNVPTTLLSQVDSSVGGKTGVNTNYGKNLVGSFYQPKLVITDIDFLKTLPRREIICGYGEILKHSLIMSRTFFIYLKRNIQNILNLKSPFIEKAIYESCKIKKNVVQKDEKERNIRKVLNFGHTFAHAYEAALGFSNKLNHGEAVILGIDSALKFSLQNNYLKKDEYDLIIDHIKKNSLPSRISNYFSKKNLKNILYFMEKDKKNRSRNINLILLKSIGFPIVDKQFKTNSLKNFLENELSN